MSDDSGNSNSKQQDEVEKKCENDSNNIPLSTSSSSSPSSTTSKEKIPKIDGPFSTSQINSSMTAKEAYFEMLRAWINQANMSQSAMACFPYYLMANYPQLFQAQQQQQQNSSTGSGSIGINGGGRAGRGIGGINLFGQNNDGDGGGFAGFGGFNLGGNFGAGIIRGNERRFGDYFNNDARQAEEELINQNGGYEFIIAPFWKRFVAETIDSIILLLLKLVLTFTIVDLFDLNFGIAFNLDNLKKSIEDDYVEILSFSSDLILIEILTKIIVCFYEALWTASGHIYIGGATPGKILLGIRIVYAEAVVPLQPLQPGINLNNNGQLRALLFPASNPGFKRALLRAMAKNILMALLFPMCFIMLFFKNNRTVYDIMTKTIVVEENPAPTLRRRPTQ